MFILKCWKNFCRLWKRISTIHEEMSGKWPKNISDPKYRSFPILNFLITMLFRKYYFMNLSTLEIDFFAFICLFCLQNINQFKGNAVGIFNKFSEVRRFKLRDTILAFAIKWMYLLLMKKKKTTSRFIYGSLISESK